MNIKYGNGTTKYGTGVEINLTGEEVALAIYSYLFAHQVNIEGAATITVNGELCREGQIYVDPSAKVIANGKLWSGRGPQEKNNFEYE